MARTNLQYARNFNPYASGTSLDELLRVRKQLSKVMNQRMKRLETTVSEISGESYTFGAYDLMQDYLKKQDRPVHDNRRRFTEVEIPLARIKELANEGKDEKEIEDILIKETQKEIRVLQGFEELKSSQISGMHEIEALRVQTFTSTDGATKPLHLETVTNKDFYDFLNSATFSEIVSSFSSEKLVEEFDRTYNAGISKEKIVEALNDYVKNLNFNERISVKGIKSALGAITVE